MPTPTFITLVSIFGEKFGCLDWGEQRYRLVGGRRDRFASQLVVSVPVGVDVGGNGGPLQGGELGVVVERFDVVRSERIAP